MDLLALEIFLAVAEEHSVTRAAERLRVGIDGSVAAATLSGDLLAAPLLARPHLAGHVRVTNVQPRELLGEATPPKLADSAIAEANVTIDAAAFYQVLEPARAAYEITNLTQALLDITSAARRISYPSDLKLGCLFVAPQKTQHSATPEELQDMVDDLQKEYSCAVAWYFPYAYRKLRNEAGNYQPGIAVLFKEARG